MSILIYMLKMKYRMMTQAMNHAVVIYVMYEHFYSTALKQSFTFQQLGKILRVQCIESSYYYSL